MDGWRRWTPLGIVALATAVAACAGAVAKSGGNEAPAAAPKVTQVAGHGATVTPTSVLAIATSGPANQAGATPLVLTRTVTQGSTGPDVEAIQQRLTDLAFDPGKVDGKYGITTAQSVWAYQHLIGLSGKAVTGAVTPELWQRMQQGFVLPPKASAGVDHLEVYLPQQVAVLFVGGRPKLITHVSTGNGRSWCEKGSCGVATTPGGTYTFKGRHTGWEEAALGKLYNPVYFNFGIAVHGATNVPNYPDSHGCVRIPLHIAEYFPSLVHSGEVVLVYDGKKDPADYGAQAPPWNTKDPNFTPPTDPSTSVAAAAPSSAAPTTKAPPSSQKPATTPPATTAPPPATTHTTRTTPTTAAG